VSEPYPTYFASKLMSLFAAAGDRVVQAASNYNLLAAYAIKRADGMLALLLINKSPTGALDARINLVGSAPSSAATVHSYGKAQDDAARLGAGPGYPDIATTTINNPGASFVFSAPPYSMNVIVMGEAGGPTNCSVMIDSEGRKIAGAGGTVEINVTASGPACPWQAAANVGWITITEGANGAGSGTVRLTVAPNPEGRKRKGRITIGSNLFVLTQKPGS